MAFEIILKNAREDFHVMLNLARWRLTTENHELLGKFNIFTDV